MTIGGLYDLFYLPADSQFAKAWKAECAEWSNVTLYHDTHPTNRDPNRLSEYAQRTGKRSSGPQVHPKRGSRLPPMPGAKMVNPPSIERIREAVASSYGMTASQVRGKYASRPVCEARQVTVWFIRHIHRLTLRALAKEMRITHTACQYAISAIDQRLIREDVAARIRAIAKALKVEVGP